VYMDDFAESEGDAAFEIWEMTFWNPDEWCLSRKEKEENMPTFMQNTDIISPLLFHCFTL
jgi:hypothetical protein